jgi:hypothetical protein
VEDDNFDKGSFGEKITGVITGVSHFVPGGEKDLQWVLKTEMAVYRRMYLNIDQFCAAIRHGFRSRD